MASPEEKPPKGNWPKDEFSRTEVVSQFSFLWILLIAAVAAVVLWLLPPRKQAVVAYCAQDQIYAEPVFRSFEQLSHEKLKVKAVFDSEAVKTVGLANRLLAETNHPQCDVFWGNEELRTRQLAARGVFRETNGWAAFGYRSRRIVINTNLISAASAPRSLLELTNSGYKGKLALAYPQFGTTATHFHALRQLWGATAWEAWCRGLVAAKPLLVDGNSVVVKMVGQGRATLGLTDSDDIAAGQREGLPIVALPMTAETLLIPNTLGLVRGGPHPETAEHLFAYLLGPATAEALVAANALEGVSLGQVSGSTLKVDWDALLRDLDATTGKLNQIFLR